MTSKTSPSFRAQPKGLRRFVLRCQEATYLLKKQDLVRKCAYDPVIWRQWGAIFPTRKESVIWYAANKGNVTHLDSLPLFAMAVAILFGFFPLLGSLVTKNNPDWAPVVFAIILLSSSSIPLAFARASVITSKVFRKRKSIYREWNESGLSWEDFMATQLSTIKRLPAERQKDIYGVLQTQKAKGIPPLDCHACWIASMASKNAMQDQSCMATGHVLLNHALLRHAQRRNLNPMMGMEELTADQAFAMNPLETTDHPAVPMEREVCHENQPNKNLDETIPVRLSDGTLFGTKLKSAT